MVPTEKQTMFLTVCAVLFTLVTLGPVSSVLAKPATYQARSNLWFDGTSTIRDWACKDVPVNGSIELPETVTNTRQLYELVEKVPNKTFYTTFSFPVKKIGCEQGETMNGHMRHALEAKTYPEIRFKPTTVKTTELVDSPTRSVKAMVTGELTIKNATRTVTIPMKARVIDTGTVKAISVTGDKRIDMTNYGVTPPTVMWTITVYDHITIHTNFLFKPLKKQ